MAKLDPIPNNKIGEDHNWREWFFKLREAVNGVTSVAGNPPSPVVGLGTVTGVHGSGNATGMTLTGSGTTDITLTLGGTLNIAHGGTGQVTPLAAFDALSPMAAQGDMLSETGGTYVSYITVVSGNISVCALCMSPDSKFLYAFTQNALPFPISIYQRNTITGALTLVGNITTNISATEGMAISPDGAYFYVADTNAGGIREFSRDVNTGLVSYLGLVTTTGYANGHRMLVVSPDGLSVYCINQTNNVLHQFSRVVGTGLLTYVSSLSVPSVNTGIAITPNGNSVYVQAATVIYQFQRSGGLLTPCSPASVSANSAGAGYQNIVISPDSQYCYSSSGGLVYQWSITAGNGNLVPLSPATFGSPNNGGAIAMSGDGLSVYCDSSSPFNGGYGCLQMSRDPNTGLLSYITTASFTGTISTTTLTVTAVTTGPILKGMRIAGSGVTTGTYITAYGTGIGGTGTYTVSASQTVGSPTVMTSNNIDGFGGLNCYNAIGSSDSTSVYTMDTSGNISEFYRNTSTGLLGNLSYATVIPIGTANQVLNVSSTTSLPTWTSNLILNGTPATQFAGVLVQGTTTAANYVACNNTGGSLIVGMESSAGNNLIGGDTAYDGIIRAKTGLAFSANDGTNTHMRLSSTGILNTTGILGKAGTASIAPIQLTSGTNLTAAAAGAVEYDGVQVYGTIDTTSGRGIIPVEQYFHLTSAGGTISTIANYFGTTSNISLVASAYYEIDIYLFFLKTTAGTVTWTLTNSAAPTGQNIYFEMSPITGIVAPPGTAGTMLQGQTYNDTTVALAYTTGTLSDATNHYAKFKIFLKNGTGTSLKIQATSSAGTITPGIGSFWFCKRLSPSNIGTFAA